MPRCQKIATLNDNHAAEKEEDQKKAGSTLASRKKRTLWSCSGATLPSRGMMAWSGTTADAAYNKVSTGPMLKQYKHRFFKTWVLAANEHSLFKFKKDAEEEETHGLSPWPFDHQDVFVCF
jgi:hypothetical protein